jgi:hypothetical protein
MKRHDIAIVPPYYLTYINKVPDVTLTAALHQGLEAINDSLEEKLSAIGEIVYAPGKWQVADILQHLIDTERIMSYRALRFARRDGTALPGFEENDYAAAALGHERGIPDLLEELKIVRVSTIYLFESFTDEMLQHSGTANDSEISVLALGFIIAGHQAHHLGVIEERYLPLSGWTASPF